VRAKPDRYSARGGTCPDFLSGAIARAQDEELGFECFGAVHGDGGEPGASGAVEHRETNLRNLVLYKLLWANRSIAHALQHNAFGRDSALSGWLLQFQQKYTGYLLGARRGESVVEIKYGGCLWLTVIFHAGSV
jgi:hypothetical protein